MVPSEKKKVYRMIQGKKHLTRMPIVQYLEEEYKKGIGEDDPMPPVLPYHYGSHYSNSGTVLHFLVRMPPFTKMFLAYQGESHNNVC